MFNDNFGYEKAEEGVFFYEQKGIPVFQNKTFSRQEEAISAKKVNVRLFQSKRTGFVYNQTFDAKLIDYDGNYQNEQAYSSVFRQHLSDVMNKLQALGVKKTQKIVEVGCGKGYFMNMLKSQDFNVIGFDPAYEGDDENIRKEYFSKDSNVNADVIIMRHTLEHISNPFSFLHTIAQANSYQGFLFVEVPTFEWIFQNRAFWDIFYEHCNYFTEQTLASMFDDAVSGNFFGGQYIYLWADLSKIRVEIPQLNFTFFNPDVLNKQFEFIQQQVNRHQGKKIAVWGAGAKGVTFLNLLDKDRKIVRFVVDINPIKQNQFIIGTGHPILPPEEIKKQGIEVVYVMNSNYIEEIKSFLNDSLITILTIDNYGQNQEI
jgi:2-polyprenyl-3-methyl-5-hydroxy-6-metoxy-1,4-benzoquinol methylase